jgi:hypothetical protein
MMTAMVINELKCSGKGDNQSRLKTGSLWNTDVEDASGLGRHDLRRHHQSPSLLLDCCFQAPRNRTL